jgi:hypothetical protein
MLTDGVPGGSRWYGTSGPSSAAKGDPRSPDLPPLRLPVHLVPNNVPDTGRYRATYVPVNVHLETRTLNRSMDKTTMNRTGRRRWAELIRFLKTTMQNAKSERVRMAAALRLADILEAREKREQLAMQAAIRATEKETVPANASAPRQTAPADKSSEPQYDEVWRKVLGKRNADA